MPNQEKLHSPVQTIQGHILKNQNLFSNNYLEHRLLSISFFGEKEEKINKAFEHVKNIYETIGSLNLGPGEEASLEDKFIRPVLKILGYEWDVQPTTQRGTKKKRPDYALFKDKASLEESRKEKDNLKRFFSHPLTILEAKYWGRRLNDADPKDTLDRRDPTAQTIKYLDDVYHVSDGRIQWAILTNGKQWRLFYYRAASRSGNFYEVDLEEIIQSNSLDNFKYFYLFFAKDALIPEPATGKTWLDQHLKGSEDYAARVSENLKELIFDSIFRCLATGFIEYRRTELGIKKETDETLKDVFNGCLTLLYRLLFLLYAESRALLPVHDQDRYYKKSLKKLKEDISKDLETTGFEGMSHKAYDYWSRLESLCRIIDKGDKALNIPIYNGGLFETPQGSFLTANKMSDPFIAQAVDLLTIDQDGEYTPGQKPFIDYSSLSVRHLGDIYEGLLEFHVRIADEPMIEVKEKGKFLWKKRSEIKAGDNTCSRILEKSDVYIENSKHERKATGSYYTPHYIVEYIVKNTVDPVLNEKLEKAKGILSELEALYDKQRKQLKKPKDWKHWEHPGEPKGSHIEEITKLEGDLFEVVFNIKVLDPAMGSGHFLVHTVDFITDRIITFLADYPENPVIRRINEMKGKILEEVSRQGVKIDETRLTEVNLIKRTVMKRCIYGVDLNEMAVELAKLSLWLDSFTLGAPLSFLDHHLKCGNSLIGTNLEALENVTKSTLIKVNMEPLDRAIRNMLFVSSLSDATYQQVKDSEQKYRDADKNIVGYRILLDILVSEYFGIDFGKGKYKELLLTNCSKMDFDKAEKSINLLDKFDKEKVFSVRTIAKEKRFFHWEIEFPEVFFEHVGALGQKMERRENPGFDCVIGNPPYDIIAEKEQGIDLSDEKEFFSATPSYKHAVGGKLNFYRLFSVLSLNLLRVNGLHGFIVPMAIMADAQAYSLRKFLLMENQFIQIEAFPQKDDPSNRIFFEAKLSTCIYIVKKANSSNPLIIRIHPGKEILESSVPIEISTKEIKALDSENLSFPSHPNIKKDDILLALKLAKVTDGVGLRDYAQSQQGEVNLTTHVECLSDEPIGPEVLRGAHVGRYEFHEEPKQGEPKYLDINNYLKEKSTDSKAFDHKKLRIGYQRGSAIDNWRRIIATTIEPNNFCSDTINYIVESHHLNLCAILALLNSRVLEWRFRLTSTNNHVNSYEIDTLPIPKISFTTTEKLRKEAVERFKSLYSSSKYDCIITDVETCLPEKSDVVHDLLAYLAEQMIEMNKKKNEEIKGFLKWLEREVGTEIDILANKTALKEYHKHDFNQLLEVLKKNRNKLSIDPSDRKKQEMLEKQFDHSKSILEPLKNRIKTTDELIDEIVYRLYGLTNEEVKLVEGKT